MAVGKPRLLDLFCGAGGTGMGYHHAGFEVVGVDIKSQKHYPFEFHQTDALEFLTKYGREYDVIHTSPPCQHYSTTRSIRRKEGREYPDLVGSVRELLRKTGRPYVIENVPGAPLINPIMLCGVGFGLKVYRHRLFESNVFMMQPAHARHPEIIPRCGRGASGLGYICVAGHLAQVDMARKAMDIDWMTRDELSQAIPPAYTEFVGKQLMTYLEEV